MSALDSWLRINMTSPAGRCVKAGWAFQHMTPPPQSAKRKSPKPDFQQSRALDCRAAVAYKDWVAVQELNLSYHVMDIWQIIWFLDYGDLI